MKDLLSGFYEAFTAEAAPIYKPKAKEDGKQIMPDGDLPDFVKERCNWALQFGEDGMTFTGMLDIIFAESDEDAAKERFYIGAGDDWLPVSEEFKKWCNSVWYAFREERVALYLIYGSHDEKPAKS